MNGVKKKEATESRVNPPAQDVLDSPSRQKSRKDTEDTDGPLFFDQTTEYIKDPETGRWVVVNPAGSTLYNNLTREKK